MLKRLHCQITKCFVNFELISPIVSIVDLEQVKAGCVYTVVILNNFLTK